MELPECMEDFEGEQPGENVFDWDGARGWKPVGSRRAMGLYYNQYYTRSELTSSRWIRIADNEFARDFAAQIHQYDSNPWNDLAEYVVIEEVMMLVDADDGLKYVYIEYYMEYVDIEDCVDIEYSENTSKYKDSPTRSWAECCYGPIPMDTVDFETCVDSGNNELDKEKPDIPTANKLCQNLGCSLEMFSNWPETDPGKLKINIADLKYRAERCDICDLCYWCLLRHNLGMQEEVKLIRKGPTLTLETENQPVLVFIARPGSSVHSYQIGGISNGKTASRL
jgi:hypothetical protein